MTLFRSWPHCCPLPFPPHPRPSPHLKNPDWDFSLLLSPSNTWKYTYFSPKISELLLLAATVLLCGVGNVVRWVVGKCLLENCLICYTLLSPSGKSASPCYFGNFSEIICKKNVFQQNIFHPNNSSRLSQGKKRGVRGGRLMKWASPPPRVGHAKSHLKAKIPI